jgi:hypothetical protein
VEEKPMKTIKDLMLINFGPVSEIFININPGVTLLVGVNGACKTTIGLNGVWFALKGLAQKGPDVFHAERFRFIGPNGKSAKAILTIVDEKEGFVATIERKITKSTTELKITASDGRKLGQAWLDEIFNIFTPNIFNLSKMSAKDQALALGIDTTEYDKKIKKLFEDRKDAKKEVARRKVVANNCEQVYPVKAVNLASLLKQKGETYKENLDTEEISTQILNAKETNEKARKYKEFLKAKKEYVQSSRALGDTINSYKEAAEDKIAHVKKANLPFSNMTIDENGGLLINNKPFCEPYFSKGEIMKMSMALAVTQAKESELKYIFIPDALSLDPKNREKVLSFLSNEGFQVIAEIADDKKIGDNSILLKEGKVVESYEIDNGGVEL